MNNKNGPSREDGRKRKQRKENVRGLTLSEISFGNLVSNDATGVVDGRVGIELHRLDHIFLDDADLERYRRHGAGFSKVFFFFFRPVSDSSLFSRNPIPVKTQNQMVKVNQLEAQSPN